MPWWQQILLVMLFSGSATVYAAEFTLQSGPDQTVMIELYTSEGCSSCPPADHFLNQLVHDHRLWQTYIPMAFHVDYWDYLGWRDRFASRANSQRQHHYARVNRAHTVYTPEFFVNGREWRRSRFGSLPTVVTKRVGTLQVTVKDNELVASFAPQQHYPSSLQLHVARLGMGLDSQIRSGENAGRRLQHQFVVLAQTQVTSDRLHWKTALPAAGMQDAKQQAVVIWVSKESDPRPLQATGGYLPN